MKVYPKRDQKSTSREGVILQAEEGNDRMERRPLPGKQRESRGERLQWETTHLAGCGKNIDLYLKAVGRC